MDENIESVEGFIAHQFPDFVASITAPIVMVIILLAVDWRFGLASLVGIILAFVAEFIGFGSGEMKENMGKYQKALEEMNNASVEYVRGMSVVKAFNDRILFQKTQRSNYRIYRVGPEIFPRLAELYARLHHNHQ